MNTKRCTIFDHPVSFTQNPINSTLDSLYHCVQEGLKDSQKTAWTKRSTITFYKWKMTKLNGSGVIN